MTNSSDRTTIESESIVNDNISSEQQNRFIRFYVFHLNIIIIFLIFNWYKIFSNKKKFNELFEDYLNIINDFVIGLKLSYLCYISFFILSYLLKFFFLNKSTKTSLRNNEFLLNFNNYDWKDYFKFLLLIFLISSILIVIPLLIATILSCTFAKGFFVKFIKIII